MPNNDADKKRESDNPAKTRENAREDARAIVERDVPKEDAKRQTTESTDDRDKVYRPDANVDNEKSPESRSEPGLNSSVEKTPLSGKQMRDKPDQKDNIREEAEKDESPRRKG